MTVVNGRASARTRRTDKAERTRQAILQAASELFAAQGFAATTISAIATKADVAAETVYSRFGNKLTLISEILETAIVGDAPRVDVLELPEIAASGPSPTSARNWPGWLISHEASWSARRSPTASCETPAPPTPPWPNSSPQTANVATHTAVASRSLHLPSAVDQAFH